MRTDAPDRAMLTPETSPAMRDLFAVVGKWAERHDLDRTQECRHLAHLLAGRLDVAASLDRLGRDPHPEPEPLPATDPFGGPDVRAAFGARAAGALGAVLDVPPRVLAIAPRCGHCGGVMARESDGDSGFAFRCLNCE